MKTILILILTAFIVGCNDTGGGQSTTSDVNARLIPSEGDIDLSDKLDTVDVCPNNYAQNSSALLNVVVIGDDTLRGLMSKSLTEGRNSYNILQPSCAAHSTRNGLRYINQWLDLSNIEMIVLSFGYSDVAHLEVDEFRSNLEAIAAKARSKAPTVLVVPMPEPSTSSQHYHKIVEFNNVINDVSTQYGFDVYVEISSNEEKNLADMNEYFYNAQFERRTHAEFLGTRWNLARYRTSGSTLREILLVDYFHDRQLKLIPNGATFTAYVQTIDGAVAFSTTSIDRTEVETKLYGVVAF